MDQYQYMPPMTSQMAPQMVPQMVPQMAPQMVPQMAPQMVPQMAPMPNVFAQYTPNALLHARGGQRRRH